MQKKILRYVFLSFLSMCQHHGGAVLIAENDQETVDYKKMVEDAQAPAVFFTPNAFYGLLTSKQQTESALDTFQKGLLARPDITVLNATGIKWKKKVLKKFLQKLEGTSITHLDLRDGTFRAQDIEALSELLPKGIVSLCLSGTNLTDFYFQGIAKALSSLEEVDLSGTKLSDFATPLLKILLETSPHLRALNLSHTSLNPSSGQMILEGVQSSKSLLTIAFDQTLLNQDPIAEKIQQPLSDRRYQIAVQQSNFPEEMKRRFLDRCNCPNDLKSFPLGPSEVRVITEAINKGGFASSSSLCLGVLNVPLEDFQNLLKSINDRAKYPWIEFHGTSFSEEMVQAVVKSGILSNPEARVSFIRCPLGSLAVHFIGSHLKVTYLTMSYAGIDDDVVKSFAPRLGSLDRGVSLTLDGNPIGSEGFLALHPYRKTKISLSLKETPFMRVINLLIGEGWFVTYGSDGKVYVKDSL